MFVGHLALAFAAKPAAPKVNVGFSLIGWLIVPWAALADRTAATSAAARR